MDLLSAVCLSLSLTVLYPTQICAIPEEDFYPFGNTTGDEALPRVLDNSSPVIPLTITTFPYFGQDHSQLYVSVECRLKIIFMPNLVYI